MTFFVYICTRLLLLLASVLINLSWSVKAQSVLLSGNEGTGSYVFAQELVRLDSWRKKSKESALIVRPVDNSKERLERLRNRQGHLAIIDANTAFQKLGKNLRLRVLTVLWPNWLHLITNQHSLERPALELVRTLLVHPSAMEAAQIWGLKVQQGELVIWNSQHASIETEGLKEDALMLVAPVPVEQVKNLLGQFENLKLVSMENKFIKRLRQHAPWWLRWKMKKKSYPGQVKPLLSLASFSVLVSRVDFPSEKVERLIKLVHSQKNQMDAHILFRNLNSEHNKFFQKTFHFHPKSRSIFGFK